MCGARRCGVVEAQAAPGREGKRELGRRRLKSLVPEPVYRLPHKHFSSKSMFETLILDAK